MDYNEFKNKYQGSKIDFDGIYGFQCTDLARAYAEYVWGKPTRNYGFSGGALEAFRNYPNSAFGDYADKIGNNPNDPNQVPNQGDIIIFGATNANQYGHIAIVDQTFGGQDRFISLDQNAGSGNGSGSGSDSIRLVTHSYSAGGGFGPVLGWLRLKQSNNNNNNQSNNEESNNNNNDMSKLPFNDENGLNDWVKRWSLNRITELGGYDFNGLPDEIRSASSRGDYLSVLNYIKNQEKGIREINDSLYRLRDEFNRGIADRDNTIRQLNEERGQLSQEKGQTVGDLNNRIVTLENENMSYKTQVDQLIIQSDIKDKKNTAYIQELQDIIVGLKEVKPASQLPKIIGDEGRILGVSKKLTALLSLIPQSAVIINFLPENIRNQALAASSILTGVYLLGQSLVDILKTFKDENQIKINEITDSISKLEQDKNKVRINL